MATTWRMIPGAGAPVLPPPTEEQHLGMLAPPAWPSPDWWSAALQDLGAFDVTDGKFGADPHGILDSTSAIQAAIDRAAFTVGGTTSNGLVWFPPGTYKLTAKLTVPRGVHLIGTGHSVTQLNQTASATPIIEGSGTNCHSVHVEGLWLNYSASQSSSASIGIAFPTNAVTYYWWSIQGVRITNAYDGIGLGNTGAVFFSSNIGTEAPVVIDESFHSAINLPSTAGSPGRVFGNLYLTQSVVTPTGSAITTQAGNDRFGYVAVSGWQDRVLSLNSGSDYVDIDALHIESCTIHGASINVVDCTGGMTRIGFASLALTADASSSGSHNMFRVINANTRLIAEQIQTNLVNAGAGNLFRANIATAGTFVEFRQWRDLGVALDTNIGAATRYQGITNYQGSMARRIATLVDAASVTVNPVAGDYLTLSTNAARGMAAPSYTWPGAYIIVDMLNNGGSGALTWDAIYLLAGAWTNPANGKRRKIQFTFDGTNWVEDWRSAADI